MPDLLLPTSEGIYCPPGDFYIDPLRPVSRALVTHGHSDHARSGSQTYLTHTDNVPILQARLGKKISLQGLAYGEPIAVGETKVSFHPAGHILGSSQIRIEFQGEVWVASGDYKLHPDKTCPPFEPVICHTFLTESTFGLPIYHWEKEENLVKQILGFCQKNREDGFVSLLCGYSLGKAQRLLKALEDFKSNSIFVSPACQEINQAYELAGVSFPPYQVFSGKEKKSDWKGGVLIGPPGKLSVDWFVDRKIPFRSAFASGWMDKSRSKSQTSYSAGFAMSDHADWEGLLLAIQESRAEQILVHHGYVSPLVRFLKEKGRNARAFVPSPNHESN